MIHSKIKQVSKALFTKIKNIDQTIFLLVGFYILSRIILLLAGFKFEMRFLETAWQTLDTYWLKTELLQSIWMLHSQPPLYNFFIGAGLKLTPVHYTFFFQASHYILGLIATVCLYSIVKKLTTNKTLSTIITVFFIISPSFILFEGLFFYDFPVLVFVIIITWIFQKFVSTNKTSYLIAFFTMAAIMILTRRVFHILWFLFFTASLLYFYKHEYKRILLACSIPLLIILFWFGKNYYYFGAFDASSWTGLGFFKTATYALSDSERQELFDKGITTKNVFFGDNPFAIPLDLSSSDQFNEKALLSPVVSELKKKNGTLNYNHYGYIDLSRKLKKEFISIIKNKPSAYLKGTAVTSVIFSAPGSNYFSPSRETDSTDNNYRIVEKWDNLYNRFIYGQPLAWGGTSAKNALAKKLNIKPTEAWRLLSPGLLIIFFYILTILYSLNIIRKKSILKSNQAFYLTVFFITMNILYICAVGILAEAGENQRHRFMSESLIWILFAVLIQDVFIKKYFKKSYAK